MDLDVLEGVIEAGETLVGCGSAAAPLAAAYVLTVVALATRSRTDAQVSDPVRACPLLLCLAKSGVQVRILLGLAAFFCAGLAELTHQAQPGVALALQERFCVQVNVPVWVDALVAINFPAMLHNISTAPRYRGQRVLLPPCRRSGEFALADTSPGASAPCRETAAPEAVLAAYAPLAHVRSAALHRQCAVHTVYNLEGCVACSASKAHQRMASIVSMRRLRNLRWMRRRSLSSRYISVRSPSGRRRRAARNARSSAQPHAMPFKRSCCEVRSRSRPPRSSRYRTSREPTGQRPEHMQRSGRHCRQCCGQLRTWCKAGCATASSAHAAASRASGAAPAGCAHASRRMQLRAPTGASALRQTIHRAQRPAV